MAKGKKGKGISKRWGTVAVMTVAVILMTAVAAVLVFSGPEPPEGPAQLLENPGFETDDITGFRKYGLRLSNPTHYGATYAQRVERF